MDDIRDLPMPALADEITSLAGSLAAGTCRFLELLAAFDAGGGWRGVGLRSCAQWLSWKCGLSTAAAHEQLRVARALTGLPRVREAFAAGRLSYSKARALTRVASVDDEESLVGIATGCTAAQLDQLCAGLARARSDRDVVAQAVDARFTAHWQPDGSLRFSGRLPAEEGAALLAALTAVRSGPPAGGAPDGAAGSGSGGSRAAEAAGPADRERPPDVAARAARDDAFALVEIARHALSAPAPAVGVSPVRLVVHTTDRVLAELRAPAAADGGRAAHETVRESPTEDSSAGVWTTDPVTAGPEAPAVTGTGGPDAVGVLDAGPGIPLVPLGPATLRRVLCAALLDPTDAADGTTRPTVRYATSRQRRAMLARDQGCAFPGCPRRRRLHAHHVRHWADGGPTTVSNLAAVCEPHHLLIHEGGWQLRRTPQGWAALDPDGRLHPASPATAGRVDDLLQTIALTAPTLTPTTVTGTWAGQRLDLPYAVGVLETNTALRRDRPDAPRRGDVPRGDAVLRGDAVRRPAA